MEKETIKGIPMYYDEPDPEKFEHAKKLILEGIRQAKNYNQLKLAIDLRSLDGTIPKENYNLPD